MKVAIRVDASADLGTGHFVRCLTLADALALRGAKVTFLARRMPMHLASSVPEAGHSLLMLPAVDDWTVPDASGWSEATQISDADAALAADTSADWLVCDHYGLGAVWEARIRASGCRVLAIDDLGRQHDCHTVLDQTFHSRSTARYASSSAETLLLGPKFALLNPAYAAARATAVVRSGPVRRLHLCMGGIDQANATSVMLDAVELAGLRDLSLDVVIGSLHPALASIAARCDANPAWSLHVQTSRMAALLAEADLALGASGTTTWERCVLGVPALAVEVAANQSDLLREAANAGFVYALEGAFDASRVAANLAALADNCGLRAHISRQAFAITDGKGAARVASALYATDICIRRATMADSKPMFEWRNASAVRAVSRNGEGFSNSDHEDWMRTTLSAGDRWLLVGERNGQPVGVARFDQKGAECAEVSIYLTPHGSPGDGSSLLLAAEGWLRANVDAIQTVSAVVMAGNARSSALFARCGYALASSAFEKRIRQ